MSPASSLRVLLVVVLLPAQGRADELGGWRYTPPRGYGSTVQGDHVVLQQVTGSTFCQLTLFAPRPVAASPDAEAAFEWENVVEKNFTVDDVQKGSAGKTRALTWTSTSANATSAAGEFAIVHYVVTPPRTVSSVLLVSNTAATAAGCAPAVKALLDSLALAAAPPAPTAVAQPTPAPTAAPAGTVVGRWATSSSDSNSAGGGATLGSTRREYAFAADGTYRFHSEASGGTYRADAYRIVDEAGTFTVAGDQLTIAPRTATQTMRDRTTAKKSDLPLEKVTYSFKRHYFEGLKEWNLVLTVARPTARDGAFASNDRFPSSYLLSDTYRPDWTYPP